MMLFARKYIAVKESLQKHLKFLIFSKFPPRNIERSVVIHGWLASKKDKLKNTEIPQKCSKLFHWNHRKIYFSFFRRLPIGGAMYQSETPLRLTRIYAL